MDFQLVVDFIKHFAGAEKTFLRGCCYWFAWILQCRFLKEFPGSFGRAKTYINQCLHDGRINKPTRAMLEKIYDIRYDEYCLLTEYSMTLVDEESNDSESTTPPSAPPFELDYARLYNIMYEAMYNAVKKAWSE